MVRFEDAESYNILSNVPNYYVSRTDQTRSGYILRVIGRELARLEYQHAYDIWSRDLVNLIPTDSLRRYRDVLGVPRDYPTKDQSDQEFHDMIIKLFKAFQLGTTAESIREVIQAYVGNQVFVDELFLKIGDGVHDVSDRNTIAVSARVGTGDNLLGIDGVKTLTETLYSALDLAKPAHVGISLSAIFGADEDMDSFILGRYGITDRLIIRILLVEEEPLDIPLWQSPRLDPATPDTRVGPTAILTTSGSIALSGLQVRPGGSWAQPIQDGDTILVKDQTDENENGYYFAHVGAWERMKPHQGLVSPLIDRVWECSDSDPLILDLD